MRRSKLVPGDLNSAQRDLYHSIADGDRARGKQHFPLTDKDGALNGPFGIMLHAPEVGTPLQNLGSAIRFGTELSARAREIGILQVARATGSTFEWYAHERVGRAVGLTDEEIYAISVGSFHAEDENEQACYEVVAALLESSVVTDEEFEVASALLSDRTLVELVVLVGYYRTLAQAMAMFDIGAPDEECRPGGSG